MTRRVSVTLLAFLILMPLLAWGGSPHMVSCTQSVSGNTLTVNGKEAGLGDETQVQVVLTARDVVWVQVSADRPTVHQPGPAPPESRQQGECHGGRHVSRPERDGRVCPQCHGDVPAVVQPADDGGLYRGDGV